VVAVTFLLSGLAAFIIYSEGALARRRPEAPPAAAGGIPLEAAGCSVFRLVTELPPEPGDPAAAGTTVMGTGTVLFGRFVLTVAHAVGRDTATTYLVDGAERMPLTPVARVEKADLALFLLPAGTRLPSFPYPIGDSETLRLGDSVALLEHEPAAGALFRPGAVAALRGPEAVSTVARGEAVFLMSLGLVAGESGAPVVTPRDGSYELVGLAQGTYIGPRQLAWAIRIEEALQALGASRDAAASETRRFLRLCRRGD
jgi:S1-C subfamily serine protease